MATYFEVKTCFLKQQDNGLVKKVTEQYLVDAMSFTEAEARVIQESQHHRDLEIASITRSKISEVVIYGDTDIWHKVKVTYTDIDDESSKEKKQSLYLLVNAETVEQAYERTQDHLKEWLVPFQIPQITESPICEVYQHVAGFRTQGKEQISITINGKELSNVLNHLDSKERLKTLDVKANEIASDQANLWKTETPELTPENADAILASRKAFTFGQHNLFWEGEKLFMLDKATKEKLEVDFWEDSFDNVKFAIEDLLIG